MDILDNSLRDRLVVQTTCGRQVKVGRLALGNAAQPTQRVSLDVGHSPGHDDGTWAALTSAEARQLAGALLRQAATADHPDGDGAGRMEVSYLGGECYAAVTRGHAVMTDQPDAGGDDSAMTPVELLVASLASCVAFYAGRYLDRHGLSRDGLHVSAEFTLAVDRPARVGGIRLLVRVPGGLPPGREAALLAVASHCTVHNTLRQAPDVAIDLVCS